MEKNRDPQIIYIAGSGHSGSTLLDLLLGSHSKIVSLGELGQLSRFFRDNEPCTCGASIRQCDFWISVRQHLLSKSQLDLFAPPKDYQISFMPGHRKLQMHPGKVTRWLFQKYLTTLNVIGSASLLRMGMNFFPAISQGLSYNFKLFDAIATASQRHHLVDSSKTWFRMKLLYLWQPESVKIIYLVRDGRGVIASHIRKTKVAAREAALSWDRTQRINLMMLQTIPAKHKRIVRYEDLTAAPEATLAEMCHWLGLAFETDMLHFRRTIHHNLSGNRMRLGSEEKIVNLERWRAELSAQDVHTFDRIAGRMNRYFGYEE